jgi:metal-responsive CopG/Arc/MetJ family transcriptional regulator
MGEHKIVSVSVEKNEFERYELARKQHGFERSEFWRKAVDQYIEELSSQESMKGKVRGALFIVHEEEKDDILHELKHSHLVMTQLHNHFPRSHECLEVLIVEGLGKRVEKILKRLKRNKSVRFVEFIRV